MPVSSPPAGLAVLHSPASRGAELSAAESPFHACRPSGFILCNSMPSGIPTACSDGGSRDKKLHLLEFPHASIENLDCRPAGYIQHFQPAVHPAWRLTLFPAEQADQ